MNFLLNDIFVDLIVHEETYKSISKDCINKIMNGEIGAQIILN
jgi:hypothetical protein